MARGGHNRMPLEVKRRYFELIRQGCSGSEASLQVGVSLSCGSVWFTDAGGVNVIEHVPISSRYLSQDDRIEIADGLAGGESIKAISARIGKSFQSVYREIARNRKPDGTYQPWFAHNQAHLSRRRPKAGVFADDEMLRDLVAGREAEDLVVSGSDQQMVTTPLPAQDWLACVHRDDLQRPLSRLDRPLTRQTLKPEPQKPPVDKVELDLPVSNQRWRRNELATRTRNTDRRAQIMDTAANLFLVQSYEGATMRSIGSGVGIDPATIYYYFPSKEAIVVEIVEAGVGHLLESLQGALRLPTVEEQLLEAIRVHVTDAITRPYHALQDQVFPYLPKDARAGIADVRARIVDVWKVLVERAVAEHLIGLENASLARLFLITAMNGTFRWYHEDGALSIDEVAEGLFEFVTSP